eukprot:Colp12_sorted_trinity150504_noHs@35821
MRILHFWRLLPARPLQMGTVRLTLAAVAPPSKPVQLVPLSTLSKRATLATRAAEFPEVVRQWHPSKNTVRLEEVSPYSNKKYWFICDEGHEWETQLYNRTRQRSGCPTCNVRKATPSNNLLAKNPAVAAEWHPTKNGDLTPEDVAHMAHAKVWWQCKEGHEWNTSIRHRTHGKCGCPICHRARREGKPNGSQSFFAAHPDIAQQWHPTKNGELTPDAVSCGSG